MDCAHNTGHNETPSHHCPDVRTLLQSIPTGLFRVCSHWYWTMFADSKNMSSKPDQMCQFHSSSHPGRNTDYYKGEVMHHTSSVSQWIFNTGISMTTVDTQCCESNLCNNQEPPALPESSTNGKKCFTCAASGDCTSTLECKGSEDRCFMFTVPAVGKVKGCASQSFCSGSLIAQLGAIVDLNCCEGNLCNNALRIGQSILFLLLVPLASFFLFN
ncbi:hypothetical protein COCON_G00003150 [Conger conger]|uniref:UPAR/Ly6 domain-containing protein n=1 Tax=Conger conger TaxID=82655 RepID=A0A9Q1I8B4_CONCO|nr:hypothetical protein COCON_G00003150 [Conger conger]